MRIAILDPFAGISGDMTLGSLIDLGGDPAWLLDLPGRLGFPEVRVRVGKTTRSSVTATKVEIDVPDSHGDGHHGRSVAELQDVVRRSDLEPSVRDQALKAFELIGVAEGQVHGVAPERVHLHEVGAVDALLDIVGALVGFRRLGVGAVYNLPVAVGTGWVNASHGRLPVPAPATAILLEGLTIRDGGPVRGEATTPTGATLLRVLSRGAPPDRWRIKTSGWGAGDRDPADYPNALRLIVAEEAPEAGVVEIVATDIDDLNPEYIEPLRAALFNAGALDCLTWTTQGKKGRVGLRIEIPVAPSQADAVIDALFAHSTTVGVRRWVASRATLPRDEIAVQIEAGCSVRVKVCHGPLGPKIKAEYGDVVAAATALGLPALEVARRAERSAETILGEKGYKFS
jgi:uncharacterized protein (TIGR00299 family) protein